MGIRNVSVDIYFPEAESKLDKNCPKTHYRGGSECRPNNSYG